MIGTNEVLQGASGLLTGTIIDQETGLGFRPENLYYSIYNRETGTFIQTELELTPVASYVDAAGKLVFHITPAHNTIIDATKDREIHVARFRWLWASGAKVGKQEIQFEVVKLAP